MGVAVTFPEKMRNDQSRIHPPGVIALSVGDLGRYHQFTMSMACIVYPPGTTVSMMQSLSVPANLNRIIREMPDAAEWLWIQGDDHVFAPDSLLRLLDRDVDVVVPLITRRSPPFSTLVFKEETEEGYLPYAYEEIPKDGSLLPVYAAGNGGMLIRRNVLDLVDPDRENGVWFAHSGGEMVNEDTEFCRRLRELEVPIYLDPSVHMGHCGMFIAWPQLSGPDGEEAAWGINIQMGQGPEGTLNAIFVKPVASDG